MTLKPHDEIKAGRALAELTRQYDVERQRVDAARRRMSATTSKPHSSAAARQAAHELTLALRSATETASRALQEARLTAPARHRDVSSHIGHRLVHHKADRSVPGEVRHWSAELVRLTEISTWLHQMVLDDDGVLEMIAPRLSNYAAKGPHIAGLDFGNQAAESPSGPHIGIDLAATIDAVTAATTRPT